MATLSELKASLAKREATLTETNGLLTDTETKLVKAKADHATHNATKVAKIEAIAPYQRDLQVAADKVWQVENDLQETVSKKATQLEQKTVLTAEITQLKADIVTAGG